MNDVELEVRHKGHHHGVHMFYGNMFMISYLVGLSLMVIKNVLNPALKKRFGFSVHPPGWIYSIIWLFLTVVFCYYKAQWPLGLTKRLGRISASMLPLSILMSLRPSPLPRTFYLNLIEFHKWVSRTLVFLGTCHGILYTIIHIETGSGKMLLGPQNLAGIVLLTLWLIMTVSSLRPIRIRWYRWFYWLHYAPAWASIPLILYHARPNVYIVAGFVTLFMVSQIGWRVYSSKHINNSIVVQNLSSTLQYITLPRSYLPETFPVGTHVRISKSLWQPLTWLSPSHPYTVASLASDPQIKLLVRQTRFPIKRGTKYSIMGPFKSPLEAELVQAKKVLVLAGGAGISLAGPVLRFLELKKGKKLKLVWVTRNIDDVEAVDVLNLDSEVMDVYITGSAGYADTREPGVAEYSTLPDGSTAVNDSGRFAIDDDEEGALEMDELLTRQDTDDDIDNEVQDREQHSTEESLPEYLETESRQQTITASDHEDDLSDEDDLPMQTSSSSSTIIGTLNGLDPRPTTKTGLNIKYGRPDLDAIAGEFMDMNDHGNAQTFVIACGPRSLINDVSAFCHRKRYQLFAERYSM